MTDQMERDLRDLGRCRARLLRRAEQRFREVNPEKGGGWRYEEARYHLYKAHDELSLAAAVSREADSRGLMNHHLADALNHMLMAMDCYDVEGLEENCQ